MKAPVASSAARAWRRSLPCQGHTRDLRASTSRADRPRAGWVPLRAAPPTSPARCARRAATPRTGGRAECFAGAVRRHAARAHERQRVVDRADETKHVCAGAPSRAPVARVREGREHDCDPCAFAQSLLRLHQRPQAHAGEIPHLGEVENPVFRVSSPATNASNTVAPSPSKRPTSRRTGAGWCGSSVISMSGPRFGSGAAAPSSSCSWSVPRRCCWLCCRWWRSHSGILIRLVSEHYTELRRDVRRRHRARPKAATTENEKKGEATRRRHPAPLFRPAAGRTQHSGVHRAFCMVQSVRPTSRWPSSPGTPRSSSSCPSSRAAAPSPRPATAASAPCAAPTRD